MININIPTMLIHMVFFLVMVVVLNQLLLKPLLRLMDERKKRSEGNREAAEQAQALSEEIKSKYMEQLEAAKKDAVTERDKVRKAAEEEEKKIIIAAREKAGDLVAEIREKIAAEYKEAQTSLQSESEAMGKEIAARILGRSV